MASSEKRIEFFSKIATRVSNGLARVLSFGRKKRMFYSDKIQDYFLDIHNSVQIAKKNNAYLKKPILWGVVFSFSEIATYWIVAISLGRPELLPFIMVGEAIGSVFDGIVPYGLYELG